MLPASAPRDTYAERLASRRATASAMDARQNRLASVRLVLFFVAIVIAWLAFNRHLSSWWLLPVAVAFGALIAIHDRVIKARDASLGAADFYERGIGRIEDRWMGKGATGARFSSEEHPYAEDLDLFGSGSLFELLSIARTPEGEAALAGWLLAPAELQVVRARQLSVDELRNRLDLREDLWTLGAAVRAEVDTASLIAWASAPPILDSTRAASVAAGLCAITVSATAGWWLGGADRAWIGLSLLVSSLFVSSLFGLAYRSRVSRVVATLDRSTHELETIERVLARFERERFNAPLLRDLRSRLDAEAATPSERIARLQRYQELLDWTENQFFAPLAAALLWTTQIAFAIERWRMITGPHVAEWLRAMGELEGLCSISGYAYEHPDDPFPDLLDEGAWFDGEGVGHPLLPADRLVRNDVRLGGETHVLIVSGSNMSGKSTLLRTVGVNTVLALAGAPVRATRLRVSPLTVGASLRVHESLQDGRSRFYAEILRLRLLVELGSGPRPLLFLLDEVLHGTNSHDRRIGATAIVRGFVERGAIGLVTTHDLALAAMADTLDGRAANVHFEDRLVDGTMMFDYRMKPGVVRSSNALALMRAVGLDVPAATPDPSGASS